MVASTSMLTKLQGASGLAFSVFLIPHLLNTVAGIYGSDAYDAFQEVARKYYLNPVVECGTLLSLAVHVLATAGRKLKRFRSDGLFSPATPLTPVTPSPDDKAKSGRHTFPSASSTLRSNIHAYSGYVLTLLVVGHVISCRFDGPAPFAAGVAWVQSVPVVGFLFSAYFIVYGAAGCFHLIIGIPIALRQTGIVSTKTAHQMRVPLWVMTLLSAVSAAGVLGVRGGLFTDVPDFSVSEFVAHHVDEPLFSFFR